MSKVIRIGQIGSGWISEVHNTAFKAVPNCEVVAETDVDEARGKQFCSNFGIPTFYKDRAEMLASPDIDMVTVAVPNSFHAPIALEALYAGKHIIVEKPLCLTMSEAQEIQQVAKEKGLVVGYAEELCYVPKFARMKQIASTGAIGKVYMIRQCEKHEGPYSPWFFKRDEAGGGALMDMGCHAIEFCRWFMDKAEVKNVSAHCAKFLHTEGEVEDHIIVTMEFANGHLAHAESSWCLPGGMTSYAEAYGLDGYLHADLLQGMGIRCFSKNGYLPEPGFRSTGGGPDSLGWSTPDYDWLYNNGYPQEMRDFIDAAANGTTPVESAIDGLKVLEIMLAAYHSAGTGKRVELPFNPEGVERPVDLWLNPRMEL